MIIVMGMPGAGKTTVLSEAIKGMPGWRTVNWGDKMLEIALRRGLVKDRDEIRKLPAREQRTLQEDAANELAKEKEKMILDTHCSINTPDGYFPGLPFNLLGKLKVEKFIMIDAPIEHIMRRRQADTTRARDAQERAKLEEQLFVNKALICAYSAYTGAPVAFVTNEDGRLDEAVERFRSLVR